MHEEKAITLLALMAFVTSSAGAATTITEIIDTAGDGTGNTLVFPWSIAVDGSDDVYVTGVLSHNAFKIENPGTCSTGGTVCSIIEIIDATGDGMGKTLGEPRGIAVDGSGNVYVAGGLSHNAFKITPDGTITEIIDASGDGSGNTLNSPDGIAVDGAANVYVAGAGSDNAFKITSSGMITEIINATGDGGGNTLAMPVGIAVADGSGVVYLTGNTTDNAFRITSGGLITEFIDATGNGIGDPIDAPRGIAVDGLGSVYLTGSGSDNAFKVATPGTCSTGGVPCTITEIISATDGITTAAGIAVDGADSAYVSGRISDNAFKITPSGVITEFIDNAGDNGGNPLSRPEGIAVDGAGNVYLVGISSDNAFKVPAALTPVELVTFAIE